MRRTELEHVIRAAASISGESEIVVVGAAALLGTVPSPPAELAQTLVEVRQRLALVVEDLGRARR